MISSECISQRLAQLSIRLSQRKATRRGLATAMAAGLTSCVAFPQKDMDAGSRARLLARPVETLKGRDPGTHALGIRKQRDSLLYIPKGTDAEKAAPLVVYLHGAGGGEQQGIKRLSSFADELGFLILSPASQSDTWDALQDGYGPDVRVINEALARTFSSNRIDARRICLSGFSDGASYALGVGLANGDLFQTLVAFSPGFIPPGAKINGKPRIFVSHGTKDTILPIDSCSRRIVPKLTQAGYQLNYREFDGPHTVPPNITAEAMRWFNQ